MICHADTFLAQPTCSRYRRFWCRIPRMQHRDIKIRVLTRLKGHYRQEEQQRSKAFFKSHTPPSVRQRYWLLTSWIYSAVLCQIRKTKYVINIRRIHLLFYGKWGHIIKESLHWTNIALVTNREKAKGACAYIWFCFVFSTMTGEALPPCPHVPAIKVAYYKPDRADSQVGLVRNET